MPYPYSYNPYSYAPYSAQNQNPAPQTGIVWVQGEAGAKSYMIAPNTSVLLMDSEGSRFYLKSADVSGMPKLRVFEFREIENGSVTAQNAAQAQKIETMPDYVTHDEFERRLKELACKIEKSEAENERIV